MAKVSDLSMKDRLWYPQYRFRKVDPLPWASQGPPLERARVAVITSAGVHVPGDTPFEKVKGGDFSYRWVQEEVALQDLVCTHPSGAWDRSGVETDMNMVLPLDRLRELQAEGVIGEVAPRHASFQGSIIAPMRLMRQTAPEVAQGMADDGVDVVLLTPV
jgi:D-proline reductase (dithiol) PrdB